LINKLYRLLEQLEVNQSTHQWRNLDCYWWNWLWAAQWSEKYWLYFEEENKRRIWD